MLHVHRQYAGATQALSGLLEGICGGEEDPWLDEPLL